MSEVSSEISHEEIWEQVRSFEERDSELNQNLNANLAANYDRIEQLKQEFLPNQLPLHPEMQTITDQKEAISFNRERHERRFGHMRSKLPPILHYALSDQEGGGLFIPHTVAEVEPRMALAHNIERIASWITDLAADEPIVKISHEPKEAIEVTFRDNSRRQKSKWYAENRAAFRYNTLTRGTANTVVKDENHYLSIHTVALKEGAFSFYDGVSLDEVKQRHGRKHKQISLKAADWRYYNLGSTPIQPGQAHLVIDAPHATGAKIDFEQHDTKVVRPLQSVEKISQGQYLNILMFGKNSQRIVAGEQIIDIPSNQGPAVWLLGEQAVKQHTLSAIESANWQQMSGERRSMLRDLAADIAVRSFGIQLK